MENLSATQTEKIFNFLNGLNTEVCITDYVNIEDIDFEDAFSSIQYDILSNGGFDIEIIYYSEAMNYLMENDPSLKESLKLASELGYTIENLNSELLASLLASQNAQDSFWGLEDEINEFFLEIETES